MNATTRPGFENPRDRDDQPQSTGWGRREPLGWGISFSASDGNSRAPDPAVTPGGSDTRMVKALESYLEALRVGQPGSRDEFLAQHSEIAGPLGECLSVLEFIQTASVPAQGLHASAATVASEAVAPRAQLGDYRLIREVGRGGMGVVYEAQQISLGRRVALKVLPFAAAIDPKQRQRFQIEAQAAAQLHHPHIVPVFGVGCDHGVHYYAMQYVDGRSLAAIIHELRDDQGNPAHVSVWSIPSAPESTREATGSSADRHDAGSALAAPDEPGARDSEDGTGSHDASPSADRASAGGPSPVSTAVGMVQKDRDFCRNVARIGVEAADALEHAHGLGILHRDIKPANLLIDPRGAVWITDFGLARFPSEFSLTGTGDIVGTLRYMSPEQAQARRGVVDQRTDIYSLGVTLYELLTFRPAFDGRDHQELLRQVAVDEPVPPRRINPAIPRDLETIVLKAMAKEPSHRYPTAQELAADLGRFLADDPILARRPGAIERTLRWGRRHWELVATAATVVVVSLAISTMLIWAQARETRKQAGKTKAAAERAEEARNAYHAYVIESYPLIDKVALSAINQALAMAQSQPDPAKRGESFEVFDQWLKILQQASELPRTDWESRIIIGRACTRLGYARALLSIAKSTPGGGLEPVVLARATEDYRRSIAIFDELLAASPDDANLRRYLADAIGVFGMGCCYRFANRDVEAESHYRRAIELRRDLVRGARDGDGNTRARLDVAGELHNFSLLVDTMQTLAGMFEGARRREEIESSLHKLNDDVVALAARFPGPEYQWLRRLFTEPLLKGLSAAVPEGRWNMIQNCRLALILDPDHPVAANNLAWVLASVPDDPWFNPKEAMALARKAVTLNPANGDVWNTLGVAAFRMRDWGTATDALKKSNRLNGGTGVDCFFLAMTCWHQGKPEEARQWFDNAIAWMAQTRSQDPELRRFHVEAASLLGRPGPQAEPASAAAPKAKASTDTARR